MMEEITIKAPDGFEFDSDQPVYIKKGEWFLMIIDEGMLAKQAISNTNFACYRLRKAWKPKQGELLVLTRTKPRQDLFIIKLDNECEEFYYDSFGGSYTKGMYELRPLTPEEKGNK